MQPKTIDLEFAEIQLFDTYAISSIKEGVMFNAPHLEAFFEIFKLHYGNKPFVSIANRKNDYTVDPQLFKTMRLPEIAAIGVVCHTDSSYQIALFEREFYPGVFMIFKEMDECIEWAEKLLSEV